MPSIGRNEPCYCGSGKKYKHCHEAEDKAKAAEAHRWDNARNSLSRDVIAFAREKRFAESFAKGLDLFWDGHYTLESADKMSQDEAIRFFDWFAFDYTPEGQPRLLDVYVAEKGEAQNEYEKKILAQWQTAGPASAYRVTAVEGKTLHLQDIFDQSTYAVSSEAGAREGALGEVLLAHLVTIRDEIRFSGTAVRLPGDTAGEIEAMMAAAYEDHRAQQPDAPWGQFLRARSYLLNHFGLKQAEKAGRAPVSGGGRAVRRVRQR
ncbi:MAG: SEC-C domain-containing protein [Thermoflexales bacterium]|nr:SEC-C domain-containing protein [Thermoflexales bacterium]